MSRGMAIALLLSAVFLSIATFFILGLPPVIRDLHQFATDLPARIPDTVARIKRLPYADQLGVDTVAAKAEIACLNLIALREKHRALDRMLEFANVARPVVFQDGAHGRSFEGAYLLTVLH